jgi:citrate lyase beta subunit
LAPSSTSPSTARTAPPPATSARTPSWSPALLNSEDNRFNRIGARLHDVGSPHFAQDVEIIVGARRQACLRGAAQAERPGRRAARAGESSTARRKTAAASLPLHVLIETHGALHEAYAIAALPQVECLSFGIMDFVSAHYGAIPAAAMRTPGQFTHPLVVRAKLEMVAACHAHDKVPSHNVTTEIKDSAVVANDAQRAAAEFGFTRMWSIHPDQIKPIVKAFTPRLSEVNEATNILLEAMAQTGVRSPSMAACTTAPATDIIGRCCSARSWPALRCRMPRRQSSTNRNPSDGHHPETNRRRLRLCARGRRPVRTGIRRLPPNETTRRPSRS